MEAVQIHESRMKREKAQRYDISGFMSRDGKERYKAAFDSPRLPSGATQKNKSQNQPVLLMNLIRYTINNRISEICG
jgi:hypothetical protein